MIRKLFFLVSVFVLSLACTSYADVLLGDFEDGSLDNWGPAWGDTEVTLAFSDFGVTSGSSSLAATVASGGYWRLQWIGEQDMAGKTAVSIDVTFNPEEWVAEEGAWAQLDAIAIQPDWYQVGPTSIINRDTGEEVGKAWGGAEEDSRRTYTWDITGKNWNGVTAVEIFLSLQWASFSQGGAFYIDNIRLIGPEPAEPKANIIVVTEDVDRDADGVRDDQNLEDLLIAEGYAVDVRPGYWTELDPNKVAELDAADLVIISRSSNSGNYDDGDEISLWNSVTSPMIQLSAFLLRNSRWVWMNSATTVNYESPLMEVLDPDNPIFAGVVLDAANQVAAVDATGSGQTTFLDTTDVGNGTLLARTADGASAWIAEWAAGVEYYDGAGQIAGGNRLMFMAGTQEVNVTPQGMLNLTAEGQLMLINAIAYMLAKEPVAVPVENGSFELPGTAKIKGWNGETGEDIPGWSSDTEAVDSGVESDWPGSTDGVWSGFMMGSDPSAYNLTDYVISAGEQFTLLVDLQDNWTDGGEPEVTISLYYDEAGARVTVASATVTPPDQAEGGWTEYSVEFAADDAPDSIGKAIGIEIDNVSAASSWIGMENVRLSVK